MAITHHPDISTLMSCAAGSQPEALAAVVASHIAMCPACSDELRKMQEIGVALFENLPAASVAAKAPVVAARAAEAHGDETGARSDSPGDVPAHLAPLLGENLDSVAWRRLAPGVWHYPIPLSKGARGNLRLVKVAPGKELPDHGHTGEELTLLLRGSYRDEIGTFKPGDIADLDDEVEHRPIADAMTGCICLIASEKKARFKGLIARLMQPFTGM
jgi:putative transcriptional regulator